MTHDHAFCERGLPPQGRTLIAQYRTHLTHHEEALTEIFHASLGQHPSAGPVLQQLSPEQVVALVQQQVEHAGALLAHRLDPGWPAQSRRFGARLHSLGVDPTWMARLSCLHQEAWEERIAARVPHAEREPLRGALRHLLMEDVIAQMEGYGQALRQVDHDRSSLYTALIRSLSLGLHQRSGMEGFIDAMCGEILVHNIALKWSSYAVMDGDSEPLQLRCSYGLPPLPLVFPAGSDPCWQEFRKEPVIVYSLHDDAVPKWLIPLRGSLAELAIFPLTSGLQCAFWMLGSEESGYFQRVGTEHFLLIPRMAQIVSSLQQQALRDPLTSLPNRAYLAPRMEEAIARSQRQERLFAVGVFDLDGFKPVNDTYGHSVGDLLLQELAWRLQNSLRTSDAVVRLGGDEFVFICEDLGSWADLEMVLERIQRAAEKPFFLAGHEIHVGASLGLTIYPFDDSPARGLLHHADLALYAAKATKMTREHFYVLYDRSKNEGGISSPGIAKRQQYHSLLDNHIVVHYQPILNTDTGMVQEVEALARLRDRERLLPPEEFLPYLSQADRNILSLKVIERSLSQIKTWDVLGFSLSVAVNIDAAGLLEENLAEILQRLLADAQIPASRLTLEIMEGKELLDGENAQAHLLALKRLGVRLALNDLGTAYEGLGRLKDFPFDAVKLDKSFGMNLEKRPRDVHFLLSVIDLARSWGVDLIVEGAHSPAILSALSAAGVHHVQGYAVAEPVPGQQIPQVLRSGVNTGKQDNEVLAVYVSYLMAMRSIRNLLVQNIYHLPAEVLRSTLRPLSKIGSVTRRILRLQIHLRRLMKVIVAGTISPTDGLHEFDEIARALMEEIERAILYGDHDKSPQTGPVQPPAALVPAGRINLHREQAAYAHQ
ncbi:putative bifunctional diguanylate cyclase/phosphodiesterase [Acidithiobacillus sp.]